MGVLSWLASSAKASDKVLDALVKGGDKLILSEEERLDYGKDAGKLWLKIQEATRDENSVRSVTRRLIALITISVFSKLCIGAAVMFHFDQEYARFLLEIAESKYGWLVIGIGGFYFGPHMLGRLKK
jgi:hypothetical protein